MSAMDEEELDEIEDLFILDNIIMNDEEQRPRRSRGGCCLFALCCLPFRLLGILLESLLG